MHDENKKIVYAEDLKHTIPIQPIRWYGRFETQLNQLKEGDFVPARVTDYDTTSPKVYCKICNDVNNCFIRDINFIFPKKVQKSDITIISDEIRKYIGRRIVAKIEHIYSDGTVELNRAQAMKETTEELSKNIGNIMEATVERVRIHDLFVDLGNGIISHLDCKSVSVINYKNLGNFFRIGDIVKIKLLNYDPITSLFTISRKKAYEREKLEVNSIQKIKVIRRKEEFRYTAEYNPNTSGIVYFLGDKDLIVRTEAYFRIRSSSNNGFVADFYKF